MKTTGSGTICKNSSIELLDERNELKLMYIAGTCNRPPLYVNCQTM